MLKALVASACLLMASTSAAQAAVINFDDVTAPSAFLATTPLTTEYSALGVTFASPGGGSVLNDASNFGIDARSGSNFLAFNVGAGAINASLAFANPITNFSVYVGDETAATFYAAFFDASKQLVGTQQVNGVGGVYSQLSFTGPASFVTFGSTSTSWVADDLSFSIAGVPEPATWGMMLIGFGAAGAALRLRRQKIRTNFAFA